jgi:hypothetical protein
MCGARAISVVTSVQTGISTVYLFSDGSVGLDLPARLKTRIFNNKVDKMNNDLNRHGIDKAD